MSRHAVNLASLVLVGMLLSVFIQDPGAASQEINRCARGGQCLQRSQGTLLRAPGSSPHKSVLSDAGIEADLGQTK